MRLFARVLLARRYEILAALATVTLVLGFFSFRIRINQRPDELLYRDDPAYPRLQAFFEEFGYDEMIAAAYEADDVLAPGELEVIRRITDALARTRGITRVLSLGNARDIVAEDGAISVVPLLRSLPRTAEERSALKRRIEENPLYDDLLVSRDGRLALFDITLDARLEIEEREEVLARINEIFTREGEGHSYYLAGSPIGRSEIFRCMQRDFSTLLPIGMLLLIASMYLVFRSYLCLLLPSVAVSLSVVWTVGFMSLVGAELNFFSVLIPTILFIIGTSDCIHILSQYQDCRYTCRTKAEAVEETAALMALPCLLTSLTTMIGFASLAACRLGFLRSFGVYSAVGIGFAFLLAITILPVGLSIADTHGLSLRRPPSEALLGMLDRLYRLIRSRKGILLPLSLGVFLLGLYGTSRLKVETDPGKFFGKKMRVVSDMHFIERNLGGFIPFFVVLEGGTSDRVKDPGLLEGMDRVCAFIRRQEGVDKVAAASDLVKYMNFRLHDNDPAAYRVPEERQAVAELLLMASMSDESGLLSSFFDPDYAKAVIAIRFRYHDFDSYKRLMDSIHPALEAEFGPVPGVRTYVTGTNVMLAHTLDPLLQGLRESLFLAGTAISILMILLFRSPRIALFSIFVNAVPITITLGLMGLLGISLNFGTAPIAAIALGLAVDDTIHFLSRFKREYAADGNYEAAIGRTLQSVGKPILITSAVLAAGFSIFLVSNFQYTRSMGMLISFTVIGAVLGDLLLLPALLLLFPGRWGEPQGDEGGSGRDGKEP